MRKLRASNPNLLKQKQSNVQEVVNFLQRIFKGTQSPSFTPDFFHKDKKILYYLNEIVNIIPIPEDRPNAVPIGLYSKKSKKLVFVGLLNQDPLDVLTGFPVELANIVYLDYINKEKSQETPIQ